MNKRQLLTNWLESIWYGSRPIGRRVLWPLSLLFCKVAERRRYQLTAKQQAFPVPIIVVGNIAVGGTGKTPLTIRLAQLLVKQGFHPGIVSRGYGSNTDNNLSRSVTYQSKPEEVGDEALLMVYKTALPVVVGTDRNQAVTYLLDNHDVDIVLSDDGLQHYAMARDLEIVVLDGERRCGNGLCLPAGPLREKSKRLQECDFVVANGQARAGEYAMSMQGNWLVSLADKRVSRPLSEFAGRHVHLVTALGNPQRFRNTLEAAGLECITHYYPDHYLFLGDEFDFTDELPILMTEKDAVKCQQFTAELMENCWFLPVNAQLDEAFERVFLNRVEELKANG